MNTNRIKDNEVDDELKDIKMLAVSMEHFESNDQSEQLMSMPDVDFAIPSQFNQHRYTIESQLSDNLRSLARQHGVSAQTLLNLWVQEKLLQGVEKTSMEVNK